MKGDSKANSTQQSHSTGVLYAQHTALMRTVIFKNESNYLDDFSIKQVVVLHVNTGSHQPYNRIKTKLAAKYPLAATTVSCYYCCTLETKQDQLLASCHSQQMIKPVRSGYPFSQ